MHVLRALLTTIAATLVVNACSTEQAPTAGGTQGEPIGTTMQALTTACTFDTIGLPCDPDGPLQPLTECQGVCSIATTGLVACTRISQLGIANLNGRVCGTLDAVGDAACTRFCQGVSCLGANAPAGAACRPGPEQSPCEGRCDGSGSCETLAQPCAYGRQNLLCKFDTCNLANSTSCVSANLRSGTLCSQLDACRVGTCNNSGTCNLNNDVACNDSNPCTDDLCDSQSGGCISTPNDANACSDGNACTVGDFCAAGECQTGAGTPDCDDDNPCTIDSCDVLVGCVHVPVVCNDGNACTTDSCDPANGACTTTPTLCDDGNACTIDGCSPATGCTTTPVVCSDADPCTTDVCQSGSCVFTPIPGCGAGGAGGGGTGGAGEVGEGGGPGEAGAGGAPTVGGESSGGAGGDSRTGEGGAGGEPGAAGETGNAGEATFGGTGAGGEGPATGGVPSTAGSPGEGGALTSGTGGSSRGNGNVVEGGGCACRTPAPSQKGAVYPLLLALGWFARRRRRRAPI